MEREDTIRIEIGTCTVSAIRERMQKEGQQEKSRGTQQAENDKSRKSKTAEVRTCYA